MPLRPTSRRYGRRLRRQFGGADAPPFMLVMNDHGSGIPEALGRWLFRYRSELAPITVGVGTAAAGAVLHANRPGLWWPIALASVAASVAVLRG
jgi:S-DNA-T family DNA segregation ATPase FtsK/SpoIIIE